MVKFCLPQDLPASVFSTRARGRLEWRGPGRCVCAPVIRLDIMDGVDGGCAVGGAPGFVGIPPDLVRQAQVPFSGELKNCANLRKSRIRNCPHCRLHPGDRRQALRPKRSQTAMSRASPSWVGSRRASCTTTLGSRQHTRPFAELKYHYLFEDRFGQPSKGNDKTSFVNPLKPPLHQDFPWVLWPTCLLPEPARPG